jgi:hypothetical protein
MNYWLEVITLHNSLLGCRNGQGTGTAVIKAKLTQQLAHIKQAPSMGFSSTWRRHLMPWIGSGASSFLSGTALAQACTIWSAISGTWPQTYAMPWGTTAHLSKWAVVWLRAARFGQDLQMMVDAVVKEW